MTTPLHLTVLGDLRLLRDSRAVPLPPSRKTRALLAYLALTARPHRRERLCEVFWDLPDDPRGSLRWALSKIRIAVNDDRARVEADRERVSLALDPGEVDLLEIRRLLHPSSPDLPPDRLKQIADLLAQPLLDGLDLPHSDAFNAWLAAEREDVLRLRLSVLERITRTAAPGDGEALKWLRDRVAADPLCHEAVGALVQSLKTLGRVEEAGDVTRSYHDLARAAGLAVPPDLAAPVTEPTPVSAQGDQARDLLRHQTIGFCRSSDGVRIAYATVGEGPPLVKAANWLNHLELDWLSLIWGKTFQELASRHTLIRYDERGNGLSDWQVEEISFDAFVRDLEVVVDALGLERFPLLGMSQGCAVSIAYAVRHPERVSALVLLGGYAAGWRIGASPEERERREAVMTLTRLGWGTNNAAYRHIFSQTFMPDGTPEELAWFDEFQRQTTSSVNAVRFQDAFGDIDVRHLLHLVRAPTLVLHARDDQRITHDQGRELAIGIPGARFVSLESRSHIILGHEPAWPICMGEIDHFLETQGL